VTDFPDDLLWDHKNCVVIPHLGASTGEAEDAAVRNINYILRVCLIDETHLKLFY